ncbi:hypothetical protein BMS3Bbin11_00798 [bacterium BMS3Bbin11]|nr:hypothetical protein BMS3Bbin11_00798 [bacterium BMS3Bbin11]
MIEVVPFTGTLTDAGKYGIAAMLDSDITDQFHHVYGLADTGTSKQTNLAAFSKGAN